MRGAVLVVGALLVFSTRLHAEPYTTIEGNGLPGNRVDIVFLGDGYTSSQLGKYANDVVTFTDRFFSEPPFQQYRPYFNVHRIDVVSSQAGADHPSMNVYKDTALGATFDCADIARLICVDTSAVNTVLARSLPGDRGDIVIVLVNDPQYGGSGGAIAVSSTHADGVDVVLHEVGHSLGLLADEYDYGPPSCERSSEPIEPNVTLQTQRNAIKWRHWVAADTPTPTSGEDGSRPGLYVGGRYCTSGMYRPTYNSKMRSLYQPFDQVNAEQLTRRIYNFVSPIDDAVPAPGIITAAGVLAFSVVPLVPASHGLSIRWELDGGLRATTPGVSIDTRTLAAGDHTLRAIVADPTPLVRSDPEGLLRDTRSWTIRVAASPTATLPSGWTSADIGAVGRAGSAGASGGTFTVTGAGADIWNNADAFHFAYRSLSGDGTIVARVISIRGTEAWTKMGVMMRASASPGSPHAMMIVSSGKGLAFQRRVTANGVSTHTAGPSGTAPRWVRLQRAGDLFTASASPDGQTWTVVGKETIAMPGTILVGLTGHSHTTAATATATFDNVSVTATAPVASSLPSGWTSADIGPVGKAGAAAFAGKTFTLKGAGGDVWDRGDAFHFAYRSLTGDGTIVARVASIAGTEAWTKMGVMMRATTSSSSQHAFMLVSSGKGLAFQRRVTKGGLSTHTAGPSGTAPRWVRLRRAGDVFTASASADGTTWTVVGSETIPMPATILVGLGAHSHTAAALATATFDGVTIQP